MSLRKLPETLDTIIGNPEYGDQFFEDILAQLHKDLSLEPAELSWDRNSEDYHSFRNRLVTLLSKMESSGTLSQKLYRVDVPEISVKSIAVSTKRLERLADLILNREMQKVWTRWAYRKS